MSESNTLRNIVQEFRKTARDILRMENINNLLLGLFEVEKELTKTEKVLKEIGKQTARRTYELSQLDPEDPDFNEKKERTEKRIEITVENDKRLKENTEKYIVELNKEIVSTNEKISDYETGKAKISIEAIQELSNKMISESYKS